MAILKACVDRDADQLVALHDKHRSWLVATNLPWLDATGRRRLIFPNRINLRRGCPLSAGMRTGRIRRIQPPAIACKPEISVMTGFIHRPPTGSVRFSVMHLHRILGRHGAQVTRHTAYRAWSFVTCARKASRSITACYSQPSAGASSRSPRGT